MDELARTALLLATLAQPPADLPERPPVNSASRSVSDPWLGSDKFQHFWVSFAMTTFSFAALRSAGQDTETALTIAVPVAAAAGVGKELFDRRQGRFFSRRDLVADALGIAAAWFLLREVR